MNSNPITEAARKAAQTIYRSRVIETDGAAIIQTLMDSTTTELQTKLIYAEDAAAKGESARLAASGMEMEIAELRAQLYSYQQLAAGRCVIQKVIDELGPQTLLPCKSVEELRAQAIAMTQERDYAMVITKQRDSENSQLRAEVEKMTKECRVLYDQIPAWEARCSLNESERDSLRSQLAEATRGLHALSSQLGAAERDRDSARAECAKLRAELESVLASARPHPSENLAMFKVWYNAEKALSSPTSAQPLLDELAKGREDKTELAIKLKPIYDQLCALKMSHPNLVQLVWLDDLRSAIDAATGGTKG